MFFIFSKILSFFILPLGWLFLWVLYLGISQRPKKSWLLGGLLLFGFLSNNYLFSFALRSWEIPAQNVHHVGPKKVAVVLTGGLFSGESTLANYYVGTHADRMIQALRLYQLGKVKFILISGGTLDSLYSNKPSESDLAKAFYLSQGVPEENIWVENRARNTHENALYSIQMLTARGIKAHEVYLVTSALLMRRSLACFEKKGWKVDHFPTNPLVDEKTEWRWIFLLPDAATFGNAHQWAHEVLGWVTYWAMGYL